MRRTSSSRLARYSSFRFIGWLVVTGMLAIAALGPSASGALAATNVAWGGQGSDSPSCSGQPSTMLWIWTGDATPTSLTINGQVQAGTWEQQGNGAWHFTAGVNSTNFPPTTTGTFVTVDGTVSAQDQLVLSGCDEGGTAPATTPPATTPPATTPPATTPPATTPPATTPPATTPPATTPPATTPPATTPPATTPPATTPPPTGTGGVGGATGTPTVTATGGVEGATGTPGANTLPPTDTISSGSGGGSDTWRVALVGLAGILAAVLLLTPSPKRIRRD